MRPRTTAFVVAIAMLLPTLAVAGGGVCDLGAVLKGQCCCDDGAASDAPASPTVERTCCCEVGQATGTATTAEFFAPSAQVDELPAPAVTTANWRFDRLIAKAEAPPVRARGPPPLRTLLAQRTALIC